MFKTFLEGIGNVSTTPKKEKKVEQKKYSVQELSDILGISVAAIRKKIFQDPQRDDLKRYKKRYPVITEEKDGRQVMLIMLTNIELEEEKRLSGINKIKYTVGSTLQETLQETFSDDVVDADYEPQERNMPLSNGKNEGLSAADFIEFTERYNNRLETYLERIVKAESQQLLLEDKAGREGLYLKEIEDARNEAKEARNVLRNVTKYFVITFLLMLIMLGAAVGYLVYKLANPTIVEKEVVVEKPVIQKVEVPVYKRTTR